jgi:hypothetical protein
VVNSHFYLGNLNAQFPNDVITVTLPIKIGEFANTKDSHTLVILYALAMDAKQQNLNSSHIALFLKAAKNKIADIKRRMGSLSGDLLELEKTIDKITIEILGN